MYPYVVPEVYFSLDFLPEEVLVGLPPTPEGFRIPLGHGLFAILVEDENGTIRSLDAIDLEESGLTSTAAHALALQNLQAFAKANRESKSFEQSGFEGPEQFPVISWLGHWLTNPAAFAATPWEGTASRTSQDVESRWRGSQWRRRSRRRD
jgi:hypothetical protein